MRGGRFAPLTIMSNEDTGIESFITTFNTAVTETASEILGKHRQKKKPWITAEILDPVSYTHLTLPTTASV